MQPPASMLNGTNGSAAQNTIPNVQNGTLRLIAPPVTAAQVKEEYITQRMNLWLSRREKEPMTTLEAALKVAGISLDKPLLVPESIKPACLIPTADGMHYYVPCRDDLVGAPPELVAKIRRINACARNPLHAGLMKEVEALLDREILERCHLEGYAFDAIARLSGKLSTVSFDTKVHRCAKARLMATRLTPSLPAGQLRRPTFSFAITDVSKTGVVDMKWRSLEWNCTFSDLKQTLFAHSSSTFLPRETLPDQIRIVESIKTCPRILMQAEELLSQLKLQLMIEGENPIRVGDPEFSVTWVNIRRDNQQMPSGENLFSSDLSSGTSNWTDLHTSTDFYSMMEIAQEVSSGAGGVVRFPIFIQPWHLRHYLMIRQVSKLHAEELAHLRHTAEEQENQEDIIARLEAAQAAWVAVHGDAVNGYSVNGDSAGAQKSKANGAGSNAKKVSGARGHGKKVNGASPSKK